MTNEKDPEVGSVEGEQETLQASQMNHPSSSSNSSGSSDEEEAEATAPSGVASAVKGTKAKGSTETGEDALVSKAVLQDNAAGKDAKGGAPATYSHATGTERGTEQTDGSPWVPGTVDLVGGLPAPLPPASPNPDGVPGAHAVGPGFRGDLMPRIPTTFETGTSVRGYRLPPADTTRSRPVPPVVEPVDEEVGGLVHARQVDDTSGLIMHGTMEQGGDDVQQAQPVEGEAEATRTAEEVNRQEEADEKRLRKIQLIIAVWCILAIILAAVIVVVQRGNADQQLKESGIDNQEDLNRTTEVTAVPTIFIPESPLLDLLPNYTLDVLKMDTDQTTPQYMAYLWMLDDPNLSVDGYYSNARLLQRYALATFYYATNGDQWESQQPEILLGPTVSNDTAITSSIFSLTDGNDTMSDRNDTITGDQGRERRLQFDPQGPPPFLAFAGFPLKGCRRRLQVPSSPAATGGFGGPQASLGFNQQEAAGGSGCGTLGEGSEWLSYETHECQWYNQHNVTFFPGGPCDSRNGDNETFAHLYLSGNNLDGTLPPELALLTGMQQFFVESNNLRGTIPDEIYGGWQYTIQDFWTRRNGLSGTLSTHIGLWGKTLNRLNIFGNKFRGTLPDALYGMQNMKMMALLQNQFTGTIAGDLLPGLKMMRVLGFSANRFSGTVPTELGLIQNLTSFTIQNNDIGGTLPTELGVLKQLDYLDVSKNDISGTIPSELGSSGLKYVLSLRENTRLSGLIPSEVENLSIENLYFQRTGLEGTLPSLWCNESDTVFFDCSPGDGLCGCNCTCVKR